MPRQSNLDLPVSCVSKDTRDLAAAVLEGEALAMSEAAVNPVLTHEMRQYSRNRSKALRQVATFLRAYGGQ